MHCFFLILIFCFSVTMVTAIVTPTWADLPVYMVKRTTEKIVIDGILDEEDWKAAQPVGDFKFQWWKEGEKEQTEAKILWNDTFYISLINVMISIFGRNITTRIQLLIRMTAWNCSGTPIPEPATCITCLK